MSCDRNYGIQQYPACSGHGECINDLCVCDKHWSSIGAYQLREGYDCAFHVPTLDYLAIIFMVISIPVVLFHFYELYHIMQGNSPKFKQYIIFAGFVMNICMYIYAILDLIDRERFLLGKSVVVAALLSLIMSGMFSVASLYCYQLTIFLKGYLKMLDKTTRNRMISVLPIWQYILLANPFVIFLINFVIQLIGIYAVDIDQSEDIYISMCIATIIVSLTYLYFINTILRTYINELEKAVQNSDNVYNSDLQRSSSITVRHILQSSREIYGFSNSQLSVSLLILFLDAGWHFFRAKLSYTLLIQFIVLNAGGPVFLKALMKHVDDTEFASRSIEGKSKGFLRLDSLLGMVRKSSIVHEVRNNIPPEPKADIESSTIEKSKIQDPSTQPINSQGYVSDFTQKHVTIHRNSSLSYQVKVAPLQTTNQSNIQEIGNINSTSNENPALNQIMFRQLSYSKKPLQSHLSRRGSVDFSNSCLSVPMENIE